MKNDIIYHLWIIALNSNLSKNSLYNDFSILSYGETEPFLVPYDGYITCYNTTDKIGYIYAKSSSNNNKVGIGGSTGMFSLPVRKGMYIYPSGSPYIAKFNGIS